MEKKKKNSALPSPDEIFETIAAQKRPLRLDNLYRVLRVPRQAGRELTAALDALAAEGRIVRLPGGLWRAAKNLKIVAGRFQTANGGGVVTPVGARESEEIFIPAQNVGDALPQDLVKVAVAPGSRGGRGAVLEIVERAAREVPAKVESRDGDRVFCRSVDRRLKLNFVVYVQGDIKDKLRRGALVSLRPVEKIGPDLWRAELENIFGAEDKIGVQEALVKSGRQVPTEFPSLALRQADSLPAEPSAEDLAGREDLRGLPFVTIDGADAKDFDDAIQVEKTPGGWLLRVAIADVSHYVKPDGREGGLDSEALKRGNSWYFPASVEPMLPEALSNGLCSLRPGVDRLAMVAEMPFDAAGNPGRPRFAPAVIRSRERLVYDDVAKFFKGEDAPGVGEDARAMLRDAFDLYKVLARKRGERGTLDFELPEPVYSFDEEGRLANMRYRERNDAHLLIEEFMIAANEAVAEYLGSRKIPFLYRCHPAPDEEKAAKLLDALTATAIETLPPGLTKETPLDPKTIQTILRAARGKPQEYVVNRLCLRAMSQARYQPANVGHFGLASSDYCHFTSPIRRYADLTVHRALKHGLGLPQPIIENTEKLAEIGEALNKTERRALECEREMARRLSCLALKPREGNTFSGVVSGATDFGLFVELNDIPAEGMVRLDKLGDDWFELDERQQALVGRRSGQTWRLGQEVTVRVDSVDLDRLEIRLVPQPPPGTRERRTKKSASGYRMPVNKKQGGKASRDARRENSRGSGRSRSKQPRR